MEVSSNGKGLIIWQTTLVLVVGLIVYCYIDLSKKKLPLKTKIVWAFILLLLPILGGLLYLLIKKKPE